ncbi:hypothetical protein RF11_12035 [Thelohanellus kitauei]|uniref:Vacuolar protein sorting/targeting protein 10 n=1 Tax=Thelohanellus kitauei TaxID=669202 RepID=A0A0C2MNG0_THEKT|nr:hypothetical protein RF11_12035 [Thelohanellus kitauei]
MIQIDCSLLYISGDYGQTFNEISECLKSMSYVDDKPWIVVVYLNDWIQIVDMSDSHSPIFNVESIDGWIIEAPTSMLVKYKKVSNKTGGLEESEWNLMILDYESKRKVEVILPNLFRISNVEQYNDVHRHYYIVVTDIDGARCLFTSIKTSYFVRVVCYLHNSEDECYIMIHPTLPGVILSNLYYKNHYLKTYISMNNRKSFDIIKYKDKNGNSVDSLFEHKLKLECKHSNMEYFPNEWMIKLKTLGDKLTHFLTFDGGKNWRIIPFLSLWVKTLNGGGIIVGFDTKTNEMVYSFDEGITYYHISIFEQDDIILDTQIIGVAENQRLVVFGRKSNMSQLIIAVVDFINIFSSYIYNDRAAMPNWRLFYMEHVKIKSKLLSRS